MNVASASGITTATIPAARTLRRNSHSMSVSSSAPSTRLRNTVDRVVAMSCERSSTATMRTPFGRTAAFKCCTAP
jgi:hypothetical protein